jgi:ketosteroid isomerase-like protein
MASAVEIHRAAHEAFNSRDWDRMRALTAPGVVFTDQARGLTTEGVDDFLGWVQEWPTGMSDARVDEPEYLDAETHSVCRFRGRGVNDGPMGPADATGRQVDLAFCEIVRVEDDRIVSGEMYYDAMTMMVQLGVVQPPIVA